MRCQVVGSVDEQTVKSERRGWWQAEPVHYHRDLAETCEGTARRAQVSSGILCYALVLGSLGCLPMVSGGGLLFPKIKRSLRPENGAEFCVRGNRGTALRNTNDCRLRCECGSRLGAYTSLDWTRIGCICLLAGIVMIGKNKVSVAIRGV